MSGSPLHTPHDDRRTGAAGRSPRGSARGSAPSGDRPAAGTLRPPGPACRIVVGVFGVLAALAGVEHGVGEILEGPVPPSGLVIQSWPEAEVFSVLGGEPALTLVPNLLLSGIATIMVATGLAAWTVLGVHRRHGAWVLAVLSVLLLVVGGGFGPPLLGIVLAVGSVWRAIPLERPASATSALGRLWPWALAAGVVGYLGLVPGTLILHVMWGAPPAALVSVLMVLAFSGVIVALVAARARDWERALSETA